MMQLLSKKWSAVGKDPRSARKPDALGIRRECFFKSLRSVSDGYSECTKKTKRSRGAVRTGTLTL
jgi:hypothetical protein